MARTKMTQPTARDIADDPYAGLIAAARDAAATLADNQMAWRARQLRKAADKLARHLRRNVACAGQPLELHRFPARKLTPTQAALAASAREEYADYDLEFDDTVAVSEVNGDSGSASFGWVSAWVRVDNGDGAAETTE